jgi:hypothetical protein
MKVQLLKRALVFSSRRNHFRPVKAIKAQALGQQPPVLVEDEPFIHTAPKASISKGDEHG